MRDLCVLLSTFAASSLDAIQRSISSGIYCFRRAGSLSLVVLIGLLLPLLLEIAETLSLSLLRLGSLWLFWLLWLLWQFLLTLLGLGYLARRISKQLLRSEFLICLLGLPAASSLLFFSLAFRRLQDLLSFKCGIGDFERGERVVRVLGVAGSRMESITPGYTRLKGVRVYATSAKAAEALARGRLYAMVS
jgi:hypothetical protein